jgi:hypothetical protein
VATSAETIVDPDEDEDSAITLVTQMSDRQILAVLLQTLNRACSAMDNKGGFEAGFLLREAQKIVALTGVTPQVVDDYDLDRGGVYLGVDGSEEPLEYKQPDASILKDAQTQEEVFEKYRQSGIAERDALNELCAYCSGKIAKLIEQGRIDDAVEFAYEIPASVARAFAFDSLYQAGWTKPSPQ